MIHSYILCMHIFLGTLSFFFFPVHRISSSCFTLWSLVIVMVEGGCRLGLCIECNIVFILCKFDRLSVPFFV